MTLSKPIDLSRGQNAIPADLEARIHTLVNGVPGVRRWGIDVLPGTLPGDHVATVFIRGWAPTLHESPIAVKIPTREDPFSEAFANEVLARVRDVMGRQKARAADGVSHGIAQPLSLSPMVRVANGLSKPDRLEMRHLHVDASLAALMPRESPANLPDLLRQAVTSILNGDEDDPGDHMTRGDAEYLLESGTDPMIRSVGFQITLTGGMDTPGQWSSYDGNDLLISGRTVPETVASTLAGRQLRDLVSIHPALDSRIVAEAHPYSDNSAGPHPMLRIRFEPDWLPWSAIEDDGSLN